MTKHCREQKQMWYIWETGGSEHDFNNWTKLHEQGRTQGLARGSVGEAVVVQA